MALDGIDRGIARGFDDRVPLLSGIAATPRSSVSRMRSAASAAGLAAALSAAPTLPAAVSAVSSSAGVSWSVASGALVAGAWGAWVVTSSAEAQITYPYGRASDGNAVPFDVRNAMTVYSPTLIGATSNKNLTAVEGIVADMYSAAGGTLGGRDILPRRHRALSSRTAAATDRTC